MLKNMVQEQETRKTIYHFIQKYPGLHIRELNRRLHTPKSTLNYHLLYLIKKGHLIAKPEGRYIRFYASNGIGIKEQEILHFLRIDTSRRIILLIIANICCSQIELSKKLEKKPKTIEFHLKKLLEKNVIEPAPYTNGVIQTSFKNSNVVERKPIGNEIIYRLKDPGLVVNVVLQNKKKLFDKDISIIIDYLSYVLSDGMPKKIKFKKGAIEERIWEILFDICPHPYHA